MMSVHVSDNHGGPDRETTILIAVSGRRDSDLLRAQLGPHHRIRCAPPRSDEIEQLLREGSFDLVIMDGLGLDQHWRTIRARKEAEAPMLLPLLLVVTREKLGYVTRNLWQVTDGLVLAPIERAELSARVEVLLRARRYSLEWQERYFTLADSEPVGVAIVQDDAIVWSNDALAELLGVERGRLVGQPFLKTIRPEDRERVVASFPGEGSHTECEVGLNLAAHERLVQMHMKRFRYAARSAVLVMAVDITERVHYQRALQWQANFDPLTGLANRQRILTRLEQAMSYAARLDQRVAVLFVGLDRFKQINEAWGHFAGDLVLRSIAQRIVEHFPEPNTVGRWSADEFIVIIADAPPDPALYQLVRDLAARVAQPSIVEDRQLSVFCHIGISQFTRDSGNAEMLVREADIAMSMVKRSGDNFAFYTPALSEEISRQTTLEAGLRRAIERDELYMVYQPKFELADKRICGAEALLRWYWPEYGEVAPGVFIPVAENTGLIHEISTWVIRAVARQLAAWQREGLEVGRVAFNVCGTVVRRGNLVAEVHGALSEFGALPSSLEMEITESIFLAYNDVVDSTLRTLAADGLSVAIDDFGTGYSSFGYLKRLPLNVLKIDQSFVRDLPTDSDSGAICRAIVSLAKSLDLTVIAEGVETEAQRSFLIDENCRVAQGFLLSRPVRPHVFADMLRRQA